MSIRAKRKTTGFLLTALLLFFVPASPQGGATNAPSPGEEIIPFLDQTLIWYQQLNAQQQLVSAPSDVLFLNDNRQTADEAVRLSFQYARTRAQSLGSQSTAVQSSSAPSQYQRLADMAAKADQQVKQSQEELDGLQKQLASATGKKRFTLQAGVAEVQSELELFEARRDAMHNMLQIVRRPGAGGGTLTEQIEEMARTVPAAADTSKSPSATTAPAASVTSNAQVTGTEHKDEPSGMFAIISEIFTLQHRAGVLNDSLKLTDALADSAKSLRAPLVNELRSLAQQGDQLVAQPDSTDPAILGQQRQQLDALTAQYKQLSAALMPLSRQSLLLDSYRRNTANWHDSVEAQYKSALKGLFLRLGGLGVMIGLLLGISEVWRRATFRYITDPRRRNQFMVLRRILLWSLIALIVAITFASELGAITTFAGLLTAGIAVALQNVILSIAGYFFLIGKYGVRVGDRVQVAGITGDIVDIGLVRLHLIEVAGASSPRPTGRAVVFSNSVVFQAGAGLFKQIPGTSFQWHEITLTLGAESNYHAVEKRMIEAVKKVCAEYGDRLNAQMRTLERSLHSVKLGSLEPESRLRMTGSGLEVIIRYPVELARAAEIDDRITREVLEAIGREPKLTLISAQIVGQSA